MIDFILLVIVVVLAWAVCISILFHQTTSPTQSSTSLGIDFYSPTHIPIIVESLHNSNIDVLSEYCRIHDYHLDNNIASDLHEGTDSNIHVLMVKPLDDKYQSLEPLIQMSNGAKLIITNTGNYDNGKFIPDLLILSRSNKDIGKTYEQSCNIIEEEVKRFCSRRLSRNLITGQDNIHIKPLTLEEIIDMDHNRKLLSYGCPVRIGRLCIISGACIYKSKQKDQYIPYPKSKHENALACSHRAAIKSSIPSKIPKIIHQTYETMVVPHCVTKCMDGWISLNPEYEYKYYTTEDCRDFISEYFPQKVLSAYDTLYPGAYKSDLWRCCVLYIKGGIYTDIKLLPAEKLIKFIDNDADLVLTSDISLLKKSEIGIFNAFMGAVPGHPLFLEFINAIVDNVERRSYDGGCLDVTGPTLLGRVLNDRLKSHNISLTSRATSINIDNKIFDIEDGNETRIQMLSLHLFPAIFDTAIASVNDKLVVYRRNPYDSSSYDKNIFHHTSGKPNYLALYRYKQVYIDNIYPVITVT